ncbi:hypothetical protein [Halopelagius fulvigenes]|uniref:Uncharacterized protein n=1 Tax=Halopelagius fulvigenes TaxID=1198324 RepID=A0ABD5TX37_9EURY
MPDENRFAKLGEAIGESDGDADAEEADDPGSPESSASARTDSESAEPTPEPEPELGESEAEADDAESPEASSEPAEGDEDDETANDSPEETAGGPAFEFEDTTAKSMYVRPETVAVLDDAEFEVESHLRREHEVRNLTGREFHDALVRVAAKYPEEVADAILDAREETK